MTYQNKQRTRIEDLSDEGNELLDLSEEVLMMVGVFGGSGASVTVGESKYTYDCCCTEGDDVDKCTVPD